MEKIPEDNSPQTEEEPQEDLGYLQETINTYGKNVDRFVAAVGEKVLRPEMARFTQDLPAGSIILDAGCGSGRDSQLFSEKGYEVTGIDLTPAFIERAAQEVPEAHFQVMDVRSLDFPDESFDAIWCRATLLHLTKEDMAKALAEDCRVLKKDGRLFVYMKKGSFSGEMEEKFSADGKRHFTFVEEDELRALIEASGLHVEEIYPHNEREVFGEGYRDLWWLNAFARK